MKSLHNSLIDISNAALNYEYDHGKGGWDARDHAKLKTEYVINNLFSNKTFAKEFVENPQATSDKVINAIGGVIEGNTLENLIGEYRKHARLARLTPQRK